MAPMLSFSSSLEKPVGSQEVTQCSHSCVGSGAVSFTGGCLM